MIYIIEIEGAKARTRTIKKAFETQKDLLEFLGETLDLFAKEQLETWLFSDEDIEDFQTKRFRYSKIELIKQQPLAG